MDLSTILATIVRAHLDDILDADTVLPSEWKRLSAVILDDLREQGWKLVALESDAALRQQLADVESDRDQLVADLSRDILQRGQENPLPLDQVLGIMRQSQVFQSLSPESQEALVALVTEDRSKAPPPTSEPASDELVKPQAHPEPRHRVSAHRHLSRAVGFLEAEEGLATGEGKGFVDLADDVRDTMDAVHRSMTEEERLFGTNEVLAEVDAENTSQRIGKTVLSRITRVTLDTEPPVSVFLVESETMDEVWKESFGSRELADAFLRGIRAHSSLTDWGAVEELPMAEARGQMTIREEG